MRACPTLKASDLAQPPSSGLRHLRPLGQTSMNSETGKRWVAVWASVSAEASRPFSLWDAEHGHACHMRMVILSLLQPVLQDLSYHIGLFGRGSALGICL
jgi:hypothetical protein